MTQVGARTAITPLDVSKGMFASGDPSTIPDGYCVYLGNYLRRPNRMVGRNPFVYDGLMSVPSFLRWEDFANQATKTYAINTSGESPRLFPYTAPNYGSGITGVPSGRVTDFANFKGKVYAMLETGGVPSAAMSFDGTNVSSSPFNTNIVARTVTAFIERLFLAYPRVTVAPLGANVTTDAYDWTNVARWVATNTNINQVTISSGVTTCRLSPTSTANNACSVRCRASATTPESGLFALAASATDTFVIWRFDCRGVHQSYNVPITLEMVLWTFKLNSTAYNVGDLLVATAGDGSDYRYRVTVAGTTGVGVTLGSTIGGTTVDGTVTWLNEGSSVVSSLETFVVNLSQQDWQTYYLLATIPAHTNSTSVTPRIKFYNSSAAALTTLAPIDISLKDGLADGDPRKQNYGQQWTLGDFYYPFFNCETATSATVNLDQIVWSEIDRPKTILAKNTYALPEVPGLPTAACVPNRLYMVFKRRAFWLFQRTTDKNIPLLLQRVNTEVGCVGPRALDVFNNMAYWIGENGIYRMTEDGEPEEIAGDAMREEIFSKAAWVENPSIGPATIYNMPLLTVEHRNKEVWVYTQKGRIYVFHIPTASWARIDVSGAPEVQAMIYDYVTQRMLVSFGGFGATRADDSSIGKDTIDNTATALSITNDIITKPMELFAPRYEASSEEVGVFHLATASQAGETIEIAYSLDRGTTWTTPSGYPATVSLSSNRVPLPCIATGPTITFRIRRIGGGGAPNWSVSKLDAKLSVHRGEIPWATAT